MSGGTLRAESGAYRRRESRAIEVAHDAVAGAVLPITIVEGDRGRSVDTEALEQRPIGGVVRRDVGAQQHCAAERLPYRRIEECRGFHFFAGGTPVGIEVDHDRAALARRLRHGLVEVGHAMYGGENE